MHFWLLLLLQQPWNKVNIRTVPAFLQLFCVNGEVNLGDLSLRKAIYMQSDQIQWTRTDHQDLVSPLRCILQDWTSGRPWNDCRSHEQREFHFLAARRQ